MCDCTGKCSKRKSYIGWLAPDNNVPTFLSQFRSKIASVRASCQSVSLVKYGEGHSCAANVDLFWLQYACASALASYTSVPDVTVGFCPNFALLPSINAQCSSVLGGNFSQHTNGTVFFSKFPVPVVLNQSLSSVYSNSFPPTNCSQNICVFNNLQPCSVSSSATNFQCDPSLITNISASGCVCVSALSNSSLGSSCTDSAGKQDLLKCPASTVCSNIAQGSWICTRGRAVGDSCSNNADCVSNRFSSGA